MHREINHWNTLQIEQYLHLNFFFEQYPLTEIWCKKDLNEIVNFIKINLISQKFPGKLNLFGISKSDPCPKTLKSLTH